jgi:hypothetical protein
LPQDVKTIYDKIKYYIIQNYIRDQNTYLLQDYYYKKYIELKDNYDKPYHDLFMIGLVKSIYDLTDGFGVLGGILDYDEPLTLNKLPLIKIYKYYSYEMMAFNYCNI